jgi:hypothetical protein
LAQNAGAAIGDSNVYLANVPRGERQMINEYASSGAGNVGLPDEAYGVLNDGLLSNLEKRRDAIIKELGW